MPPARDKPVNAWPLLIWSPLVAVGIAWGAGAPWSVSLGIGIAAGAVCTILLWKRVLQPALAERAQVGEQVRVLVARVSPELSPSPTADLPELASTLERLGEDLDERLGELRHETGNLRNILEASPWPMFATNGAGEVVVSNRAAEEFFQRGPGGLAGRPVEDLVTQSELITLHAAALAGRAGEGQVKIPRSDGTRIYQVRTAPVKLALGPDAQSQTGVVVSLRDITELATALQLKTDFVANASHELRTPVSSIKAAIETLADGAWEDEAMRARFSQMISQNATRLEDMIRDLLDLSRLESPEGVVSYSEVNLQELLEDIGEELGGFAAQRTLTLKIDVEPAIGLIRSDPKLLRLVVKNLVDNATKYAYPETAVRMVARTLPAHEPGQKLGVRIQVIDRGAGIPINQQQRVFERFFQVDPARTGFQHRRGTGLGLAIVKHAVKALGGTIGVESVWKQGTTMTVELPDCVITSSLAS